MEAAPLPKSTSAIDLLVAIVPSNPVAAAATGDMLAWLFFSLFFGVGLALTQTPGARVVQQFIAGLFDVCMKLMDLVLKLAPLGVGALMFAMTARVGLGVLVKTRNAVAVPEHRAGQRRAHAAPSGDQDEHRPGSYPHPGTSQGITRHLDLRPTTPRAAP